MTATDKNVCEYEHVHDEVVEQVSVDMPDEDLLYDAAELFKIFGDSTRLRILYVLYATSAWARKSTTALTTNTCTA